MADPEPQPSLADAPLRDRIASVVSEVSRDRIDALLPEVYDAVRKIAGTMLRRGSTSATFEATALVHEAYARVVSGEDLVIADRHHLLRLIAQRMRWILIDRSKRPSPRDPGSGPPDGACTEDATDPATLEAMDVALERLRKEEPVSAAVVDARIHFQWDDRQIGRELGISEATVRRKWRAAKAWLAVELGDVEGIT